MWYEISKNQVIFSNLSTVIVDGLRRFGLQFNQLALRESQHPGMVWMPSFLDSTNAVS